MQVKLRLLCLIFLPLLALAACAPQGRTAPPETVTYLVTADRCGRIVGLRTNTPGFEATYAYDLLNRVTSVT